jgi:hypothetical protein
LKRLTNTLGGTLHRAEAAVLMGILDAFALQITAFRLCAAINLCYENGHDQTASKI